MRIFLLLVLPIVFLSSCSKYQCLGISSGEVARNEKNELILENDSLKIQYGFLDKQGTVFLSIFNKSSHGISVDWSRSSVIVRENSTSFFNPELRVQGELDKTAGSHAVVLNATASQPRELEFIPPGTTASRGGPSLTRGKFLDDGSLKFRKEKLRVSGFTRKIKRVNLEKVNSPLLFRVYLTLLTDGRDDSKSIAFDKTFYVSEVVRTRTDATAIFPRSLNSNMIIMKKSGAAALTLGTIGLVILVVAASGG